MTVFAFRYSSCVHEEGMVTISLHETASGAIKAMKEHKAKKKKGWDKVSSVLKEPLIPFGSHSHWDVKEIEVQN